MDQNGRTTNIIKELLRFERNRFLFKINIPVLRPFFWGQGYLLALIRRMYVYIFVLPIVKPQ